MFRSKAEQVRHRIVKSVLLACAVLIVAQSGCVADDDRHGLESSLRRGLSGEPESLDPHKFTSNQAANVLRDIGEGLVSYDRNGRLVPAVAEAWQVSKDGLTYRFELRDDAKWSNGVQVVAHDFVHAFQRLVDPNTAAPYASLIDSIVGVKEVLAGASDIESLGVRAESDDVLTIQLSAPTPYFLQLLTHPSTFPIAKSDSLSDGEAFARIGSRLSNGAYFLVSWELGAEIVLARNPEYWANDSTYFDRVIWVAVDDLEETNRFRAGELDTTESVSAAVFRKLRESRPDELIVAPSLGTYFYGFNLTQEPFADNPKVREALSMAIDREAIVTQLLARGEKAAFGWVPPGIDLYDNQLLSFHRMGREERELVAKRLYREAGYDDKNPLQFELRYNTSEVQQRIALAAQSMWRDVLGAEVTLVNEEFRVLLSNIQEKRVTQLFRLSWTGDYSDPYAFLQLMESDNPSNFMGLKNEEIDSLLRKAAVESDPDRRMRYLADAEALILRSHSVIPIYFYVSKHLVKRDVVGWGNNVLDIHYSKHLSRLDDDAELSLP